jgi:hypothetical protein
MAVLQNSSHGDIALQGEWRRSVLHKGWLPMSANPYRLWWRMKLLRLAIWYMTPRKNSKRDNSANS